MNSASKVEVTRKFQEHGLEGLPAKVYRVDERPSLDRLTKDFGGTRALMVRTGSTGEARNLPRYAGASPSEAEAWIKALPPVLDVIVQPYDPVVFSVELAIYEEGYVGELVPGVWELSTEIYPAVVISKGNTWHLSWTAEHQLATFHTLERGYFQRLARIEDWQISALVKWIRVKQKQASRLRSELGANSLGIKLHYAAHFGLSPQNVRTDVPVMEQESPADKPDNVVYINSVDDLTSTVSAVALDVSIAREEHEQLSTLVSRLLEAGAETVYLKSGLLSHLAITLREAGFKVRRFDATILRD